MEDVEETVSKVPKDRKEGKVCNLLRAWNGYSVQLIVSVGEKGPPGLPSSPKDLVGPSGRARPRPRLALLSASKKN